MSPTTRFIPGLSAPEGRRIEGGNLSDYSIYYPEDSHPNGAAHAAFAEAIYERILTVWGAPGA